MILLYKIRALFNNETFSENIKIETDGEQVIKAGHIGKNQLPILHYLVPEISEPDFNLSEFNGWYKVSYITEVFEFDGKHLIELDRWLWRRSIGEFEYIGWMIRPKNVKYLEFLKSFKIKPLEEI